ncbi:DUF11 domain-containing protein [Candidatus Woesearchaeota archaeon]|nr:MAG: DUF11 domain-containing protein [Candidatus Woesearchaeota archaeon]
MSISLSGVFHRSMSAVLAARLSKTVRFSALLFSFFSLLLISSLSAHAEVQVEFRFDERGKIISYYDNYFVTNVNGTAWVINPSNVTLYDVVLPFTLYPMTVVETSGTHYIDVDKIVVSSLPPMSNISFEYKIVGIPLVDPMDPGRGVFESGIVRFLRKHYGTEEGRLYSSLMGSLQKSNLEKENVTGRKGRLVTVVLSNPTPFKYYIERIRIIKTAGMNPNQNYTTGWLATWEFPNERFPKRVLEPGEIYDIDVLDTNASEGEVYWLSSDVYIPDVIITGSNSVKRFTQEDVLLIEGEEVEALENGTNISLLEQPVFIQKSVSKTVFQPGDTAEVEIALTNLGFETREGWLYDSIPSGFQFASLPGNSSGTNATWHVKIPPKKPLIMRYSLLYSDNISIGLDYFPAAKLVLSEDTLYSQTIPFVRQYVPEKMIYIQKTIRYSINDEVVVKIDVMNMGQTPIKDVVLKEYLASSDVFREISKQPYSKGVWKIDEIPPADTWTVTYVTNERAGIELLPQVFGVSSSMIMKTLVMENVVRSDMKFSSTRFIEILGLSVAVLLPVIYFVVSKRRRTEKVRRASELERRIKHLKRETEPDTSTKIRAILNETRSAGEHHRHSSAAHSRHGSHHGHKPPEQELSEIEQRIRQIKENAEEKK